MLIRAIYGKYKRKFFIIHMNIESEGENTIVSTKDWEETKTPERKPATVLYH